MSTAIYAFYVVLYHVYDEDDAKADGKTEIKPAKPLTKGEMKDKLLKEMKTQL